MAHRPQQRPRRQAEFQAVSGAELPQLPEDGQVPQLHRPEAAPGRGHPAEHPPPGLVRVLPRQGRQPPEKLLLAAQEGRLPDEVVEEHPRFPFQTLAPEKRCDNFDEVVCGYHRLDAMAESLRCLHCDRR